MSTIQETKTMNKSPLFRKKGIKLSNIPSFSSTEELVQYVQNSWKKYGFSLANFSFSSLLPFPEFFVNEFFWEFLSSISKLEI